MKFYSLHCGNTDYESLLLSSQTVRGLLGWNKYESTSIQHCSSFAVRQQFDRVTIIRRSVTALWRYGNSIIDGQAPWAILYCQSKAGFRPPLSQMSTDLDEIWKKSVVASGIPLSSIWSRSMHGRLQAKRKRISTILVENCK